MPPGKLSNHFLLLSIFVLMVLTGGFAAWALDRGAIQSPPALVLISAYDSTPANIFFSRTSSIGDCSAVLSLARYLPRGQSRVEEALKYLIQNKLTARDRADGYQSNFPDGARLASFNIIDGVASVSLSGNFSNLSSCRLTALRSQLESTLLQFSEIKSVSITLSS